MNLIGTFGRAYQYSNPQYNPMQNALEPEAGEMEEVVVHGLKNAEALINGIVYQLQSVSCYEGFERKYKICEGTAEVELDVIKEKHDVSKENSGKLCLELKFKNAIYSAPEFWS